MEEKDIFQQFEEYRGNCLTQLREKFYNAATIIIGVTKKFPRDIVQRYLEDGLTCLTLWCNKDKKMLQTVKLGSYSYDITALSMLEDYLKKEYPCFDNIESITLLFLEKKVRFTLNFSSKLSRKDFYRNGRGVRAQSKKRSLSYNVMEFSKAISYCLGYRIHNIDGTFHQDSYWSDFRKMEEEWVKTYELERCTFILTLPIVIKK